MKQLFFVAFLAFVFSSCTNGQNSQTNLTASQFAEKIKELPQAPIIDVRTPEEFANGHLVNAINYNWNDSEFDAQIAKLDKAKPVFVYCLSGGRSASAASAMREMGFKIVYELDGGIMKWRSANLPETTANTSTTTGMTQQQFEAMLGADPVVLVDFYAEWCAPCKKMKPYLDEIATTMGQQVKVIRIDADANPTLCAQLQIEALPTLQVYKSQKLTWAHTGYIDKAGIEQHLK